MDTEWNGVLAQALQCLSRACERFTEKLERDEVGVKELRELTAVMKELTALQRQLNPDPEDISPTVEVSFDDAANAWSQ